MSTNSLKYIILQVDKSKFNQRFYNLFDSICKSLNTVNNEEYWIFPIDIQLPSNSEENILLQNLLITYMSSYITHIQILKHE